MTWEKEKAYKARKAEEYGAEMEAAIEAVDKERFNEVFSRSFYCMTKKQHDSYMKRFIEKYAPLHPIGR